MSWNQILQIDPGVSEPLRQRIDALFTQQRETWPLLRDGEAALGGLQRKTLTSGGESVVVQINPARRRSTQAKTDAKSVAARACFLCPKNMPAEERGMAFEDLVVMPNPFPVLPLHATIAGREHLPQRIPGRVEVMLRLAKAVRPDLAVFYNGPRCGASAPDHFHFQAARADAIPILAQLPRRNGEHSIVAHSSFGRNMLIFGGAALAEVGASIERAIDALPRIESADVEPVDEPMLNLIAHFQAGRFTAVLFPRAAHRPACYFKTGDEQLAISPAVLEMCGVLVTTEPDHFARVDAEVARAIFEEVSISKRQFEELANKVAIPRTLP
jgi:hypothetical protein